MRKMLSKTLTALTVPLAIAFTNAAHAQDLDSVRIAVESYEGFTTRDGSGLFHEVFKAAYAISGIAVQVEYFPVNRSMALVEAGEFDMTGGLPKDDRNFASWPILDYRIGALHRSDNSIDWSDSDALTRIFLVGSPQTAEAFGLPINEVDDRAQALRLLLSGRADAFVDIEFILQRAVNEGTLITAGGANVSTGEIPDKFIISTVNASKLYMLFSPNDRGQRMREAYDEGVSELAKRGELEKIYSSHGQITPSRD